MAASTSYELVGIPASGTMNFFELQFVYFRKRTPSPLGRRPAVEVYLKPSRISYAPGPGVTCLPGALFLMCMVCIRKSSRSWMDLATKMVTTLENNYSCALDKNSFKHDRTGV